MQSCRSINKLSLKYYNAIYYSIPMCYNVSTVLVYHYNNKNNGVWKNKRARKPLKKCIKYNATINRFTDTQLLKNRIK